MTDWRLTKFIITHALVGIVAGTLVSVALVWNNIAGLGDLTGLCRLSTPEACRGFNALTLQLGQYALDRPAGGRLHNDEVQHHDPEQGRDDE